jgi:hypothetical protein
VPTPVALALPGARRASPLSSSTARRPPFIAAAASHSPFEPRDRPRPSSTTTESPPCPHPPHCSSALDCPASSRTLPLTSSSSRSVPRSLTTRTTRRQRAGGQRQQAQQAERDRPGRNPGAGASETSQPRVTRPPRLGSHRPQVARQVTRRAVHPVRLADRGDGPLDRRELNRQRPAARDRHSHALSRPSRQRRVSRRPAGRSGLRRRYRKRCPI